MTHDQDSINKRVYHTSGVERFYGAIGLDPPEALALLRAISEFPHRDILDLGVGAGRTARYLSQLASRYECIDYSPVMIERLRRTVPSLSARQGDMRDLSAFEANSFDLVLAASNVISAVSHDDRLKVLSEVQRVLRPGGVFVFSSHNRNSRIALNGPRLRFSRNPVRQLANVASFVRQTVNHARTSKFRKLESDYALLTDTGHDYSLLHYYIDRKTQRAQLTRAGFELLYEITDAVRMLGETDDDSDSNHIHYVARRA
jgi:SAM-dependent methyltransferase